MFDEVEVLGPPMNDESSLWDELLDDLDEDSADDEGGGAVHSPTVEDDRRAARAIQPFCRIYILERDIAGRCSLCLEGLRCEQVVWRVPCMRVFHEECAIRCFGRRRAKAICPLCRSDIRMLAVEAGR